MSVKKMTFFFVNSYVIIAGDKTVLFDCGAILEPEKLPAFLEEQGVDPKDIDLIILSLNTSTTCSCLAHGRN